MGKVVVEESIVVNAPKAKVWQVFRDLEQWPKWNAGVVEAKWVLGEPWVKGSTFQFSAVTGKRKNTFNPIILEANLENRVVWLGKLWGVKALHTYRFEEINRTETKVTSREEFSGALLSLGKKLVSEDNIRETFTKSLTNLKEITEQP